MPRADFNTTCDLVYGASGLFPGVAYASGPCRVVPEAFEILSLVPLSDRVAYITLDFAIPNDALVANIGTVFTTSYDFADVIVVPSGGDTTYGVLFVETVTYLGQPIYYRAHVRIFE